MDQVPRPSPPTDASIEKAHRAASADTAPSPLRVSDATRYLCAAAQLNSSFARRLLDEVLDEELRAPPAAPGVDLVPVLLHAVAARRRQLARDAVLVLLLLALAVALVTARGSALLSCALLLWLVVLLEQLIALYGVAATTLTPTTFDPDGFSRAARASVRRRLERFGPDLDRNVTVYSGFDAFAAYGVQQDPWSIVVDVSRAKPGQSAQLVSPSTLHEEIARRVCLLGLPGLVSEQRAFVDGRDLLGDTRLRPASGPPETALGHDVLQNLLVEPEDRVRPYACFHVVVWGGQLVLSSFLRCVLTKQHLSVDVTHTVLPPVREEFQEVDHLLERPTVRQLGRLARRAARDTIPRTLSAPGALGGAALGPWHLARRRARQRREIAASLRFDFGPRLEPRRLAADAAYQRYFQRVDDHLVGKLVERALLGAVIQILDEHGIDTDELAERRTTILNNGVWIGEGASVKAGSIAAGPGSQAVSGIRATAARATGRGTATAKGKGP